MATFIQSFTLTGGESPSGALVTTTSQQIAASQTTGVVSASGPWDVWTLTAGQQISRNGTVDSNTALVTQLYYSNHTLYQFNGTNWYYYNTSRSTSTTFSWNLAVDPTAAIVPNVWDPNHKSTDISLSSNGLTATLTAATATNECVFAKELTAAGPQTALLYWEVVLNAANTNGLVGIGTNASNITNGALIGNNTSSIGWRGDTGTITSNNASIGTWATYANGARLCFALDLVNGKLWGRVGGGNWNNNVITSQDPATNIGGLAIPTTIYVVGSGTVFVVPGASLFRANNVDTVIAAFEPASWLFTPPVGYMPWSAALPATVGVPAVPTIQSVVLSGSKTFTTGTTNAVVGTIAVTMSNGSFTGTLGLGGADAASFQIVNVSGTSTLETNGALSIAKTYSVNIIATQSSASNSPFTSTTQSIVGTSAGTLTAPSQASAAGFSTLVFSDDFTTSTTIATNAQATQGQGFKWYWVAQVDQFFASANSWSVDTTTKATGSNASTDGGILSFHLQRGSHTNTFWGNSVLASINTRTMQASSIPANCSWQHGYIEFYAQTPNVFSPSGDSNQGWPALWSSPVESIANGGFGTSPSGTTTLNAPGTEVDFLETQGGLFGNSNTGDWNFINIENPAFHVPAVFSRRYPTLDTNWHTYGFLWQSGTVQFFYDNVAVGASASTTTWNLESCNLFIILGSGINWPLNLDWVRVWR